MSEVGGRKSEVGGRKSEVGGRRNNAPSVQIRISEFGIRRNCNFSEATAERYIREKVTSARRQPKRYIRHKVTSARAKPNALHQGKCNLSERHA